MHDAQPQVVRRSHCHFPFHYRRLSQRQSLRSLLFSFLIEMASLAHAAIIIRHWRLGPGGQIWRWAVAGSYGMQTGSQVAAAACTEAGLGYYR
jgi:hypothetical protein